MNTKKNTILITGGSAGIGFEMAKLFSENDNQVIITGRNRSRLEKASARLQNVIPIVSDVSNPQDITELVGRLTKDFPTLNIVINNAGLAFVHNLSDENKDAFSKSQDEMLTNYFSVVRLNEQLIPLLKKQPHAAIVNVSSIVAIVPGSGIPTYAASKAALHSYTLSLRLALRRETAIKVFELMPPLVNTEFSQDIGGANGIHPTVVAEELLSAMKHDQYEVRVGNTENIYKLYLSSPEDALVAMNGG